LGLALVLSILSTGANLKFYAVLWVRNEMFPLEVGIRIAHEVEKRLILWDIKSSLYKSSDLKPAVWEEIARALGAAISGKFAS